MGTKAVEGEHAWEVSLFLKFSINKCLRFSSNLFVLFILTKGNKVSFHLPELLSCLLNGDYFHCFPGTNPQNLRLTLLNANSSQAIRVAIWYSTPQRLDVYRAGVYMYPTNAKLNLNNFGYKKRNPNLPDDQFEPQISSVSGTNYYDRESQLLYVVVKGNVAVDVRTAPVIQVKLGNKYKPLLNEDNLWPVDKN